MAKRGRKTYDAGWDRKVHELRDRYPEVDGIDWGKIFKEQPEVFSAIAGSVAKVSLAEKEKLGVEVEYALSSFYEPVYAEMDFADALEVLWGERTIAEMAHLTGISAAVIRSLKLRERPPLFEEMEQIAAAFDLTPGYFMEYRIASVLAAVDSYLMSSPETATAWFNKVESRKGLQV